MDTSPPDEPDRSSDAPPPSRGPSPLAKRVLIGLAVVAVIILLFTVVFPWFRDYQDDPTLEGAPGPVVALARH